MLPFHAPPTPHRTCASVHTCGLLIQGVKCNECGGSTVVGHMRLSGGTYAEERTIMQMLECKDCGHMWRG